MLDSDLSALYGVETRRLNEQVKRNMERFPDDFMFQLSKDELDNLMSQNATSSWGGTRKLPYAFTEQGIAMLSAVLRSNVAIQVSIKIMNTFVEMRRFMANNSLILNWINEIEVKQLIYKKDTDEKFDKVFQYISERQEVSQKIFFEGQIYDEGYFSYEDDGFGPVCYDYESTVDAIIGYIENDCKNPQKYIDRVNAFFQYNDTNNCERIYKAITKKKK